MKHLKIRIWRKTKSSKYSVILIILIGASIVMLAPIFHIKLPKTNPNVDRYKKELQVLVKQIDDEIEEVKKTYEAKSITGEKAYEKIFNELLPAKEKLIVQNKILLDRKIDSERIYGWRTWRAFANGWGQRLPYVVFMLAFTFLFFAFKIKDKLLYWALIIYQLAGYTMTIYQQVYSFWPGQDLDLKHYKGLIFFVGFLLSVCILILMRFYTTKSNSYKRIIRMLNGVLVNDVKYYVKDEVEYEENLMWPTLKKVRDEI